MVSKIIKLFWNKKIQQQHSVLSYRIGLYFPKHKLEIEFDEKGYIDRDERKANERCDECDECVSCKSRFLKQKTYWKN